MNKKISKELESLLSFFPNLDPPITVSQEVIVSFSSKNKPIPQEYLESFFARWDQFDEFTEMVPCFSLKTHRDFYAIVYWKGSLMTYEYVLLTLDMEGNSISKKVIAGTISNGQTVKKSVATIDEDLCIYSVVGETLATEQNYNPPNSKGFRFEILPDGTIKSSQEENNLWEEEANPAAKN